MLPKRRSVRLEGRDYGGLGSYFVTICTHERRCSLSRIEPTGLYLSRFGRIIEAAWAETLVKRPYLEPRQFVIMPNHVHALLSIMRTNAEDAERENMPRHGRLAFQGGHRESLPVIVGAFKSAVTKSVNRLKSQPGALFWQRGYYEHVVKDESDFATISQYIVDNPERWLLDRENGEGTPDKMEEDFWKTRLRLRLR